MEKTSTVCVTGGAGYLGSWLVRKLLQKGHTVHATLRNLGDESKTELLRSFDGAEQRLKLFEADIYDAEKFDPALRGCSCIFLVATPYIHNTNSSQYKDTTEASVAAVRSIMRACKRSGSVKRVIYTGTMYSSSPLKEDGSGFKDSMDESCWTPLHLPYEFIDYFVRDYMQSKTVTEKELLSYNVVSKEGGGEAMEVVSLVCGLVGGDTALIYVPGSMSVIVSPLTGLKVPYKQLKTLQLLLGSVPLLHIDDVCEAHVFCLEQNTLSGRFLCASANPTMHDILAYYERECPHAIVTKEVVGGPSALQCSSTKLLELGFKHKHNAEQILRGSVASATRLGRFIGLHGN